MAVSHQNAADAFANAVTSVTLVGFDPGAGSNRALGVGVQYGRTVPTSTGCTYGGVTVPAVSGASGNNTTVLRAECFCLANPSSTPSDIVVSWTGSTDVVIGAEAANGVDQATPAINGNFASGVSTSPSVTITGSAGDMSLACFSCEDNQSTLTQTQRWLNTNPNNISGAGSTASGGATHGSTQGSSSAWAAAGFDFLAAAGGGGSTGFPDAFMPAPNLDTRLRM